MSDKTIRILLLAVILFLAVILCVSIIDIIRKKRRDRLYIQLFEEAYKANPVVDVLLNIISVYKQKSVENLVLQKAIGYLQRSCLRDYQTAFAMIEDVFTGKNVKRMHSAIIELEKGKMILLLEKKE